MPAQKQVKTVELLRSHTLARDMRWSGVTATTEELLKANSPDMPIKKRAIAVHLVDIFSNDSATFEVK